MAPRCRYVIRKPGKDDRACANSASFTVDGLRVCGIHANLLHRKKSHDP